MLCYEDMKHNTSGNLKFSHNFRFKPQCKISLETTSKLGSPLSLPLLVYLDPPLCECCEVSKSSLTCNFAHNRSSSNCKIGIYSHLSWVHHLSSFPTSMSRSSFTSELSSVYLLLPQLTKPCLAVSDIFLNK